MYKNGLRFSTMSVLVARKSRLQSPRPAKHTSSIRISALKMIDRNARLIAGVINGLLISILKAAEG